MPEREHPQELTLELLISLFKFHRKFILTFIISSLIIVGIYSYIMPQEYQSSATLLPPEKSSSGGGLSSFLQSVSGGGGLVLGNLGKSNQSQVFSEILKSRAAAMYIDDKLKLSERPEFESPAAELRYDMIRSLIEVEVERSGLILVTASAYTPYFAGTSDKDSAAVLSAELSNAAVDGLNEIVTHKNVSTAKQTKEYIERELSDYKVSLDSIQRALEKFQIENNVLSLEDQFTAIVNQAIQAGAELAKAESDLNLALIEYDAGSQKVRTLTKQVEFLRRQSEKVQNGGLSSDAYAIPLKDLPEIGRLYADLYREQQVLEQVILYLETQRHQEAIREERDLPVIEVLDPAVPPIYRSSPNRKLMLLLTLILSSSVAMLYVSFRAYFKGKLFKSDKS